MALVKCTECGKEFSDTLERCPHCGHNPKAEIITCPECGTSYSSEMNSCPKCGFKTKRTGKITIYGYNESYIGSPDVEIYIEGKKIGTIPKGGKKVIEIDHDCIIDFKCKECSGRRALKVDQKEQLILSITPKLMAIDVKTTTAENHMQDIIDAKQKNKKNNVIWYSIIIIFLIIFFVFILPHC